MSNVRTGCLKALSFVFEYVGAQSVWYTDSVITMLEDALTDRDLVHRQMIVKHLALGVADCTWSLPICFSCSFVNRL